MNVNLKACLTFSPLDTQRHNFNFSFRTIRISEEDGEELERSTWLRSSLHTKEKLLQKLANGGKRNKICRGHSLFSPEAVIYLGRSPTLNHCVCFYGLSGFVCAPQPLKLVWGTADFCLNLGIVKPHCFLTLERCLASHMGR